MRMLKFMGLILMLPAGSCVSGMPVGGDALCDGTRLARADHAAALAAEGSDRVVITGARLIQLIDAGCAG